MLFLSLIFNITLFPTINIPQIIYPLPIYNHLGCFGFNNTATDILVFILWRTCVLISLRYIIRNGITGLSTGFVSKFNQVRFNKLSEGTSAQRPVLERLALAQPNQSMLRVYEVSDKH